MTQSIRSEPPHILSAAFPSRLSTDVNRMLTAVPQARLRPTAPFEVEVQVEVQGEVIAIPYRVYNDEPSAALTRSLTGHQQMLLHWLYTRHHDGRVRQRHLESVIDAPPAPWAVPYVMQLAGEYVLEILETIRRGLDGLAVPGSTQRRLYGEFITRNPAFFARTERRVVSYWSCYHRHLYPVFGTYPGSVLMDACRSAASEVHGERWPRNTPPPLPDTHRSS